MGILTDEEISTVLDALQNQDLLPKRYLDVEGIFYSPIGDKYLIVIASAALKNFTKRKGDPL